MSLRTLALLVLTIFLAACSEEAPSTTREVMASCLTSPLPAVDLAAVPDQVIAAADTDSLITGEPTKEHRVYLPPTTIAVRDELLVFLGGSGGEPARHKDILRIWAHAGYRSISLAYMNEEPVGDLCATVLDASCEGEIREETAYGDATHDSLYTTVSEQDSIVYRLRRLLEYLDAHRPGAGFGAYLDANGEIRWDKIVLGGFSQGGGNVGILSRDFLVARAFFLSKAVGRSTDAAGVPDISPWVHDPRATPADRLYGIVHELEDAWSYTPEVFDILGMDSAGAFVRVDNVAAPYGCTHQLSTTFPPACGAQQHHKSMSVDACLARDAAGRPLLTDAYLYLVMAGW